MEVFRALLGGRRCLVVGSAPLDRRLCIGTDELVVAVNGGIASVHDERIGVWMLNARRRPYESWSEERVRLNEAMVRQGAGRHVGLVAWIATDDDAPQEAMAARLRAQGTTWATECLVSRTDRERIETRAGARTPAIRKHAISAGMFAGALCLDAGAAIVRMVGLSWEPGYAYLPDVALAPATRGHIVGDRFALEHLLARYGDRLEQSLTPAIAGI